MPGQGAGTSFPRRSVGPTAIVEGLLPTWHPYGDYGLCRHEAGTHLLTDAAMYLRATRPEAAGYVEPRARFHTPSGMACLPVEDARYGSRRRRATGADRFLLVSVYPPKRWGEGLGRGCLNLIVPRFLSKPHLNRASPMSLSVHARPHLCLLRLPSVLSSWPFIKAGHTRCTLIFFVAPDSVTAERVDETSSSSPGPGSIEPKTGDGDVETASTIGHVRSGEQLQDRVRACRSIRRGRRVDAEDKDRDWRRLPVSGSDAAAAASAQSRWWTPARPRSCLLGEHVSWR